MEITGKQIKNTTIQRQDIDVATPGQAVVAKIVQGNGITISSTGADSGTGDVTVNAVGIPNLTSRPVATQANRIVTYGGAVFLDTGTEILKLSSTLATPINYALSANGSTASASKATEGGYPDAFIDGTPYCTSYPTNVWLAPIPATLEVNFGQNRVFDRIDIYGLRSDPNYTVTPSDSETDAYTALSSFTINYWNGSSWVSIPECTVSGQHKIVYHFSFAPVKGSKVQIAVTAAGAYSYCYLVEFMVWGL